ncbi:MAG: STM4015 family protein [Thiothrix sp.]|nr:STM4015 family protein [Thiothrix sp.]HPE58998.1 STM4015 family protein [Thiolinea sp.]
MMGRDAVFAGKPLGIFEMGQPLPDPASHAIFVGTEYDGAEFSVLFEAFVRSGGLAQIDSLVIGLWGEYGDTSRQVVDLLVAHARALPRLQALFIGNISQEESEISWIEQDDISPLYVAFPQLAILKVRGGQGLKLGALQHAGLRTLVIESGGLDRRVLAELVQADLPALRHLELWLGDEGYGNNSTGADLEPLLNAAVCSNLHYLGLRNADNADEVARTVAAVPATGRVQVLDLSLGNLTDAGGEALLAAGQNGHFDGLQLLDLHHHYLSDELMVKLQALPVRIDLKGQLQAERYDDETYRMIFVSE